MRSVWMVTLALFARVAVAQNLAPRVEHQPVAGVVPGQPVEIGALITSSSAKRIYEPSVMVKIAGVAGFVKVPMHAVPGAKDFYAATIPANLAAGDFDYYVEAFDEDGNGPGRVGSPERPIHVTAGAGATPPPPPIANPNASPGLLENDRLKFAGQEDPRTMNNGTGKIVSGSIILGIGTVCLLLGIFEWVVIVPGDSDPATAASDSLNAALLVILGVVGIGVGTPLLIVGLIQRGRYLEAMTAAGLQVHWEPHARAPVFSLAMRF